MYATILSEMIETSFACDSGEYGHSVVLHFDRNGGDPTCIWILSQYDLLQQLYISFTIVLRKNTE